MTYMKTFFSWGGLSMEIQKSNKVKYMKNLVEKARLTIQSSGNKGLMKKIYHFLF